MFHLFAGSQYSPFGGMDDYQQSFATLDAAKEEVTNNPSRWGWATIATETNGKLERLADWQSYGEWIDAVHPKAD